MKKTQIAAAVLLMCAGVAQATVPDRVIWKTDTVPTVPVQKLSMTGADLASYKNDWHGMIVASGAAGQLDNLALDISAMTPNSTASGAQDKQVSGIYVEGGDVVFGGSLMSVGIDSDLLGAGNNNLTALGIWDTSSTTLAADVTNLSVTSRAKDGKAIYGVSLGGKDAVLNLTGKTVNINLATATDRSASNYSEAIGLDIWGGKLVGSANTVVNINGTSTAATPATNYRNNASSLYGMKFEGGQGQFDGTVNVNLQAKGGNATGVGVTNYFYNSTTGENWNSSTASLNNVNVVASSESAKAAGIDVSYTAGAQNDVILTVNGTADLKATTDTGKAYGISVTGPTSVVMNGNVTATATASEGFAASVYADSSALTFAGASTVLNGNVYATDAKIQFGKDAGSTTKLTGDLYSDKSVLRVNGKFVAPTSTLYFGSPLYRMLLARNTEDAVQAGLILGDGATIDVASIQEAPVVELGSGANLTVSEDSSITELNSNGGTLTLTGGSGDTTALTVGTTSGDTTVVLDSTKASADLGAVEESSKVTASVSSSAANSFATPEEAAQFALNSVKDSNGATAATTVTVAESESNGGLTADVTEDGQLDTSTIVNTVNTKTAGLAKGVSANVLAFRLEMNDMNKRLGELRDSEGATGVWARVNGGKQKYQGSKNDYAQLQFGADTRVDALYGVHVGGAFSYTDGDMDLINGSGDNKIYGLAAYGSWLGDNGSFIDVIGKVARLETDATVGGTDADFNTTAFSLSAELGHRFAVTKSAFVEPQLELNYGYVDGKSFDTVNKTSGIRTATELSHVNSLVGRLGVRAGLTCPNKKGNVYVRASVLREFEGDVTMKRGSDKVTTETGDTWFEYGIGGNYNVTPNTQIYADLERTSGADLSEPWRFVIGGRWAF